VIWELPALSLYILLLRALGAPPGGFSGVSPGFVEIYQLPERFNGLGMVGAELGLAAIVWFWEK